MKTLRAHSRLTAVGLIIALAGGILLASGCGRGRHRVLEVAYVSAPQVGLRDQVAAIYNRVGNVKNGDRVEVLEREKHFARVRTSTGIEGWIEQRFLVDQKTFDAFQKLAQENQDSPVQAPGVLRNETNLHITPGRDTEHLYQLSAGAKVAILKRATAEKQPGLAPAAKPANVVNKRGAAPAGPVLEDWWLVRDDQSRVGWVLARMVDVDAPLDIAQYAEGQRFVAFFVLDTVQDPNKQDPDKEDTGKAGSDKSVSQYLCAFTEPHDGSHYDYDQIRVF